MMDEPFEFAAELTFRERVWMIVRGLAIGGAILLVWHLWLNPEIKEFAAFASCRTIFGVNGIAYVWYGVAVGVPLFGFFLVGLPYVYNSVRIFRDGQAPPVGVKVLRRTRIRRGAAAQRIAYLQLLAPLLWLAVAIWGFFLVRPLVHQLESKHSSCTANYSLKRTAAGRLR